MPLASTDVNSSQVGKSRRPVHKFAYGSWEAELHSRSCLKLNDKYEIAKVYLHDLNVTTMWPTFDQVDTCNVSTEAEIRIGFYTLTPKFKPYPSQ